MDKSGTPTMQSGAYTQRMRSAALATDIAKRLHKRSIGFVALSSLLERAIEKEMISKEEDGWIWSILVNAKWY